MPLSRREFARLVAGTGALAAYEQLGLSAASAAPLGNYRAMVGVFLYGGNDGWNTLVPTDDDRYRAYAAARGPSLALRQDALVPLAGVPYGLHPALAALKPIWDEGAMTAVMNVGTLFQPLTRALYQLRSDLRPINLMSHSDEQNHWSGLRARSVNVDGFMGRINDRMGGVAATPQLISIAGSNLALIGRSSAPLVLSSTESFRLNGTGEVTREALARQAAVDAFAGGSAFGADLGAVTGLTGQTFATAYRQGAVVDGLMSKPSAIEECFIDARGQPLTNDIALQLKRAARMIELREALGHQRQVFFVNQGGFDTHADQVIAGDPTSGEHAKLLADLGDAVAAFHRALQLLGVADAVTTFTMSDFGRTYRGNASMGSDHAWGSNHLVIGGAVQPGVIHGTYPDQTLGGSDDCDLNGRWIPSLSQEEYIGPIARWFGVADADLPYVFPNWSTWLGRNPVPIFA